MHPTDKQLNSLRRITADARKKAEFRAILETRARHTEWRRAGSARIALPLWYRFATAPTAIIAVAVLIAAGTGTGAVFAAHSAIPGDALYPIKRAVEKARLTVTTDTIQKAALHIELSTRRAEEAAQLLEQSAQSQPAVAAALAESQEELSASQAVFEEKPQEPSPKITETVESRVSERREAIRKIEEKVKQNDHDDERLRKVLATEKKEDGDGEQTQRQWWKKEKREKWKNIQATTTEPILENIGATSTESKRASKQDRRASDAARTAPGLKSDEQNQKQETRENEEDNE